MSAYQPLVANEHGETGPTSDQPVIRRRAICGACGVPALMICAFALGFVLGGGIATGVCYTAWHNSTSTASSSSASSDSAGTTVCPPCPTCPTTSSTAAPKPTAVSTVTAVPTTGPTPPTATGASLTCEAIPESRRIDCGWNGISENQCIAKGCCWKPSSGYWCYSKQIAPPAQQCFVASKNNLATPPFSDDEVAKMKGYFFQNIDMQGLGGIVAAPDHNTGPGGDYWWHWARDSALTMKSLYEMYDFKEVEGHLKNYVGFLVRSQYKIAIHNDTDTRAEPKFILPNGEIFTDPWCRPQPDGPGLTAITLILLAEKLIANGDSTYVSTNLWTGKTTDGLKGGLIKYELDWLASNWGSSGCDLWEEFSSNAFFWNRINYKRAFLMGSKFAAKMGDTASATNWLAKASAVNDTLLGHWNGEFVYEAQGREQDTAVIIGFNDGYWPEDKLFNPTSKYCASTIQMFNNLFCNDYAINKADTAAGIAGVLYGRYKNDKYDGGNPWHLLSAGLAVLLYRGAVEALTTKSLPAADALSIWAGIFQVDSFASVQDFAKTLALGADGVLERIRHHVAADDFHCWEQIDRNLGTQTSAHDLTWSYAMVLQGMHHRQLYMDAAAAYKA